MTSTLPRKFIVTAVCQEMILWGIIHGVKRSVCCGHGAPAGVRP